MMSGLEHVHSRGKLHRDIKGANILIDRLGRVKLADFGLARSTENQRGDYTNRVITLWYRPPELLLGETNYSSAVDIWGLGCLLFEMVTKKPIFAGTDEISQIDSIYKVLGTPSPDSWPAIVDLPWYHLIIPPKEYTENSILTMFEPDMVELGMLLLQLDPQKRLSCADALTHAYFQRQPAMCRDQDLPLPEGDWHEFETKQRRKRAGESSTSSGTRKKRR